MSEGISKNSCGRYDHVGELFHSVAEHWEDADRLRSIQESKKGADW